MPKKSQHMRLDDKCIEGVREFLGMMSGMVGLRNKYVSSNFATTIHNLPKVQ